MKQIDEFINSAEFLPPAFQLIPRLLLLLDDVESNSEALADLIRADPGLTANILRVCNSAAYGLQFPVENIQQAVLRIGFREVHRVVLTVIASPVFQDSTSTIANNQVDLWNHSLAAAFASQSLALHAGIDLDLAFTSALLHDIGKLVLTRAVPEAAASALRAATEQNLPLFRAERNLLKIDHAAAGGRLLDRWRFPKAISNAVRHHHDPANAKADLRLACCVSLANVLAYHVEGIENSPKYVHHPDAFALEELDLSQPAFESMAPDVRTNFNTQQKLLL